MDDLKKEGIENFIHVKVNVLDTLVDFAECGTKLHSYGRVCAWCCVICAALGAILAVVPAWQGLWTAIGAGRVLLYMLAWIIVPLALRTLLQK